MVSHIPFPNPENPEIRAKTTFSYPRTPRRDTLSAHVLGLFASLQTKLSVLYIARSNMYICFTPPVSVFQCIDSRSQWWPHSLPHHIHVLYNLFRSAISRTHILHFDDATAKRTVRRVVWVVEGLWKFLSVRYDAKHICIHIQR